MIDLRPHQTRAIDMIREALREGFRAPTLVASTGFGKTRVSAVIASASAEKFKRVLFFAPRRNLVFQTWKAFRELGVDSGMIMADVEAKPDLPIQIASIDTVMARLDKSGAYGAIACHNSDIIIIDEGHLYASKERAKFINDLRTGVYGKGKIIMLLTATPCTTNGGGLGNISDKLLIPATMHELIDGEYLLRPRYFSADVPDLSSVRMRDDEYNTADLGKVYDSKIMGNVVESYIRHGGDRPGVVFCATRANAADVCDKFNAAGIVARYADAKTPDEERKEIFNGIESGKIQVIVNCLIIGIGTDIPRLNVVSFAMATKSVSRWVQGIGRAARPYPGQHDFIVIDHGGMIYDLGRAEDITDWSLDGATKVQYRVLARKKAAKERKDIKCPSCKEVFKSAPVCPHCGTAMKSKQKGEAIEYHDVELVEIVKGKKRQEFDSEAKESFYRGLLGYAAQKKYKDGWASFKYEAKFGVRPRWAKIPETPSEDVIGYIKYLAIKNACKKQRPA